MFGLSSGTVGSGSTVHPIPSRRTSRAQGLPLGQVRVLADRTESFHAALAAVGDLLYRLRRTASKQIGNRRQVPLQAAERSIVKMELSFVDGVRSAVPECPSREEI